MAGTQLNETPVILADAEDPMQKALNILVKDLVERVALALGQ